MMHIKNSMSPYLAVLTLLLMLSNGLAAAEPVSKSKFRGVAIGGQDAVAYHALNRAPQDKAVKGSKSYIVKWKGAKWRFASKESSEKFKADPDKFSPAYNGFCANALSLKKGLLRTDGTHWEIIGDKLYLFYAAAGRERWTDAADIAPYLKVADEEWSRLSQ